MLALLFKSWLGRLGIFLLLLFGALSIYVLISFPKNFGSEVWNNPNYWVDYPKSVPPAWARFFSADKGAEHIILEKNQPEVMVKDKGKIYKYVFNITPSQWAQAEFVSFSVENITFYSNPPIIDVLLENKEGQILSVFRHIVPAKRETEAFPVYRYVEFPFRENISLNSEIQDDVQKFLVKYPDSNLVASVRFFDSRDDLRKVKFVFGGSYFGWLGTDDMGRDIFQGILFGLPYALLVAISVGILTTIIGAIYGSLSAFWGGKRDAILQLIVDIIIALPLLPILIFLVFVMGPSLRNVILFLIAFGWTGLVVHIRPWVFQIKASPFVEFSLAKGFGSLKLIFWQVIPQVSPYLFTNFVISAPTAIVVEASLSFIGLGDPSIPTWGQLLQRVNDTGAIALGYWWQYISPGLAIVSLASAFLCLFLALEPITEPRLRRE